MGGSLDKDRKEFKHVNYQCTPTSCAHEGAECSHVQYSVCKHTGGDSCKCANKRVQYYTEVENGRALG